MGRVDLVYLPYELIIEYEGDQHRTDARDKWTLIRVTSEPAGRAKSYEPSIVRFRPMDTRDFHQLWINLFE